MKCFASEYHLLTPPHQLSITEIIIDDPELTPRESHLKLLARLNRANDQDLRQERREGWSK